LNDAAAGPTQLRPQFRQQRRLATAVWSNDCAAPSKIRKPRDEPLDVDRPWKLKPHRTGADKPSGEGVLRRAKSRLRFPDRRRFET
jgi:hypothetical protein